jgi:hypothetical protein
MTALRTRAGCKQLAELPATTDKKRLHILQAELPADSYFTHRLDDDGTHVVVYDRRQIAPMTLRQLLGIYLDCTEGPLLDGCRDRFYDNGEGSDTAAEIWATIVDEIDRTQDPDGVMSQIADCLEGARRTPAGNAA